MNKTLRSFVYLIIFTILIGMFVYLGKKDYGNKKSDAELFSMEYPEISTDNMFKYIDVIHLLDLIKNGEDAIILIGFSSNEWMQKYVKYVYPVFKEHNLSTVYYYDVQEDRSKGTKYFKQLEEILSEYLKVTDQGVEYLFTPALVFIKDGEIMYFDDETALTSYNTSPNIYWSEEKVNDFQQRIAYYLEMDGFSEQV